MVELDAYQAIDLLKEVTRKGYRKLQADSGGELRAGTLKNWSDGTTKTVSDELQNVYRDYLKGYIEREGIDAVERFFWWVRRNQPSGSVDLLEVVVLCCDMLEVQEVDFVAHTTEYPGAASAARLFDRLRQTADKYGDDFLHEFCSALASSITTYLYFETKQCRTKVSHFGCESSHIGKKRNTIGTHHVETLNQTPAINRTPWIEGENDISFALAYGVNIIGSAPQKCNIVLRDPCVSRVHAFILCSEMGRNTIQDIGAGVSVNRCVIAGMTPTSLRDGDSIGIGTYKFVFHAR